MVQIKNCEIKRIISLFLCLGLIVLQCGMSAKSATVATVSSISEKTEVNIGDRFTVSVMVENGLGFVSGAAWLTFDSSLVKLINIKKGDTKASVGLHDDNEEIADANTRGYIVCSFAFFGSSSKDTFSVYIATFEAIQMGTASFGFIPSELLNLEVGSIAEVNIGEKLPYNLPTVYVVIDNSEVKIGEQFTVNVRVDNSFGITSGAACLMFDRSLVRLLSTENGDSEAAIYTSHDDKEISEANERGQIRNAFKFTSSSIEDVFTVYTATFEAICPGVAVFEFVEDETLNLNIRGKAEVTVIDPHDPMVSAVCEKNEINVGDQFTVAVRIDNGLGFQSIRAWLTFDPALVRLLRTEAGGNMDYVSLQDDDGISVANAEGKIDSFAYALGSTTDSLVVYTATFEAIGVGTADFDFVDEKLEGFKKGSTAAVVIVPAIPAVDVTTMNHSTTDTLPEKTTLPERLFSFGGNGVTALETPETVKYASNAALTKSELVAAITGADNAVVTVKDKDGNEFADGAAPGTGSTVTVTVGEATVTKTLIVLGDVDGDGVVNASDARLALRAAAKLDVLEGPYASAADIDGDNTINATDARKILRIAAKLDPIPEANNAYRTKNTMTETTTAPTTVPPSVSTTAYPTPVPPTVEPSTKQTSATEPMSKPTTEASTTEAPTTEAPTTEAPTTEAPATEAPTTEVPTTEAPTTEVPTTEAPTIEPTSATEPTSDPSSPPSVPEYDVGVDASLAKSEKPKVYYIKVTLSEKAGDTPVEFATDGRNTYMRTKGDISGTGTVVDIGIINKNESGLIKTGNGLYLINYEKSKYLYMPESIISMAGMDSNEFGESLGSKQIDIPKITNVSELKPIANEDGTVTVRLHDSAIDYTDYVFASVNDTVPIKVTHYVGDKVVSTLNVESYTEDANTVKSYLAAPKGFAEVKLSLSNIDEMTEFMDEIGMA